MTRMHLSTRLLVAAVGLLAVLLALGATTSRTAAAWTDRAAFTARATAATWVVGPVQKCEVVTTGAQPQVVSACTVTSVQATNQWGSAGPDGYVTGGGLQFQVATSGYTPAAGRQARITVDLTRITGTTSRWNWAAGSVVTYNGVVSAWAPPFVTFTTYEYNASPFGAQFNAP
ncbi:hypothetical protein [Cellulomonas sp. S1-8]|uniref:hypothetical protein n=1 Tax=Cellulomonas sp. S1-8 TaxID=2904790 RepID=UPI002242FA9D|nr:hypothetical protein [Cellulomonas sp. S1-8]UZN04066.1 hypothetical protein OKX07_03770 [Cellulomonas sp. S1-8]